MSKKYIFAALLVIGAALAADLGSLLDLVKGGYAIVIGRAAKVDDVLAAVDLATRLAQAYSAEKIITLPIEVVPEYEIKGWEARLYLDDRNLQNGAPGFLANFHYDSSVLPQLKKIIVRNGTVTIKDVPEKVEVGNVQLGAAIYENATLQLVLVKDTEYVKYYVDLSNKGCVFPDIGSGSLVRLKLAGKDVVISGLGDGQVTLLEGFGPEWLNAKDERAVGNYKVRLDDVIGFGDDAIVKVSILDAQGNVVGILSVSPKTFDVEPESGIKVVVLRAFGYGDTRMAYMLAGIETTINNNDRLDNLFKWYIMTTSTDCPSGKVGLAKIGYVLSPNEIVYVKVGEEIAFPNNYFKLKFLGLTASDKDYLATLVFKPVEIDVNKVYKVEGVLSNRDTTKPITIDKRTLEISGAQFLVTSAADNQNYFANKVYVVNVTYTDTSNRNQTDAVLLYYDERTGNYTAALSVSIPIMNNANVDKSYSSTKNEIGAKIGTTETYFTVTYDFLKLSYDGINDYKIGVSLSATNNTWVYTAYGHRVFLSADGKELRLAYTPVRVYARVVLGDVVEKAPKVQKEVKVTELEKEKLKVPVAYFDDEELPDVTLIVVGGPVVNKVAAEVLGLPYGDSEAAKKFFENATAVDKAIIKIGEYKGKTALVIAGWRASDTRFACQLLQRFDEFAELKNKTAVVVGGTLESPTITELKV